MAKKNQELKFCLEENGKYIDIEDINALPMQKGSLVLCVVDRDSVYVYVRYIDMNKPFYIEV